MLRRVSPASFCPHFFTLLQTEAEILHNLRSRQTGQDKVWGLGEDDIKP